MYVYLIYRDTTDFDPSSEVVAVHGSIAGAKKAVGDLLEREVVWEYRRAKGIGDSDTWHVRKRAADKQELWVVKERVL
jgi:hypothetical protein